MSPGSENEEARPHLRVVRGDPSPEEVAALTAVLAAASGGADGPTDAGPSSTWADRTRLVRRPVRPGPNGWRTSALPG